MYCIVLRSKHTGKEITLGSKYETREEAEKYADKNCCKKCNSINTRFVNDDVLWKNKEEGFTGRTK